MPAKTGKAWSGELSNFGRYLKQNDVERERVATLFDITPAYVSMLAHGKATPAFALARRISDWTKRGVKNGTLTKPFTCDDWILNDA